MKLYVLKHIFRYDEIEEVIGVFDTKANMEKGKAEFRQKFPYFQKKDFNFSYDEFELNKVTY